MLHLCAFVKYKYKYLHDLCATAAVLGSSVTFSDDPLVLVMAWSLVSFTFTQMNMIQIQSTKATFPLKF